MLRYLQTIPRFILGSKTLARPSTELTRISKALTSGSLTMVLFVTRKRRWQWLLHHTCRAVKTARDVRISYGDSLLEQKRSFKYLCVIVDESLSWNSYISYVAFRVYPKLKLLNRISFFLDPTTLLKIYKVTILPILDYGCILWGPCSKKDSDFRMITKQGYEDYLKGKSPDLFANDERQTRTFNTI